jgi:hypothetical protein
MSLQTQYLHVSHFMKNSSKVSNFIENAHCSKLSRFLVLTKHNLNVPYYIVQNLKPYFLLVSTLSKFITAQIETVD